MFLINTEMCMSWLLLILIVSMHGSTMKFFKIILSAWGCVLFLSFDRVGRSAIWSTATCPGVANLTREKAELMYYICKSFWNTTLTATSEWLIYLHATPSFPQQGILPLCWISSKPSHLPRTIFLPCFYVNYGATPIAGWNIKSFSETWSQTCFIECNVG